MWRRGAVCHSCRGAEVLHILRVLISGAHKARPLHSELEGGRMQSERSGEKQGGAEVEGGYMYGGGCKQAGGWRQMLWVQKSKRSSRKVIYIHLRSLGTELTFWVANSFLLKISASLHLWGSSFFFHFFLSFPKFLALQMKFLEIVLSLHSKCCKLFTYQWRRNITGPVSNLIPSHIHYMSPDSIESNTICFLCLVSVLTS